MLNTVVLIGRLTKDPELRYTTSGKAVATLRLAVDRGTKDPQGNNEVDWIDCVVWEKTAETAANYLQKGRLVAVQGRLQIRQYETREGQKREKAEVVASTVRFLDKGKDDGEHASGPKTTPAGGSEPKFTDDDDVPF
ncbi:MAG TPA: single-stranded DNA-binding protein [Symbiobacteriaceae bacterium]|jgi:single-strand DNA-binding protein